MASAVYAADIYELTGFADPNERLTAYGNRGKGSFKAILQHLLFYDTVWIGAEDFFFLVPLLRHFGTRPLTDLFESGALRLVWVAGRPTFGRTIDSFGPGDFAVFQRRQNPDGSSALDEPSVEGMIREFDRGCRDAGIPCIPRELLATHTTKFDLEASAFEVCDRLRSVLRSDTALARWAGFSTRGGSIEAPPVRARTIHTVSVSAPPPSVAIARCVGLLQAFSIDHISTQLGIRDSSTRGVVTEAVSALRRTDRDIRSSQASLLELNRIPDVSELLLNSSALLPSFIKLRDSKAGSEFRRWFHEHAVGVDSSEIAARWVDLMRAQPWVDSAPARVLRFIATSVAGLISPPVGLAAGIANDFAVPAVTHRRSAKQFIHQIDQFVSRADIQRGEGFRGMQ